MLTFLLWLILAVLAWPLAVVALLLYPLLWLLSLPFRLVGISLQAVLDLVGAVIRLPAPLARRREAEPGLICRSRRNERPAGNRRRASGGRRVR